MKKILAILISVTTIFSISTTAFAHGHRASTSKKTQYALCTVETCYETKTHKHNNVSYKGHYNNDGHKYHEYCNQSGCEITSFHSHDGVGCYGHKNEQTNSNTHHNNTRRHHR